MLRDFLGHFGVQINDVLLTATARAFHRWNGSSTLLVDMEGHGREPLFQDVDLSRTVGWFTSIFPFCVHLPDSNDPAAALECVKQQLSEIPDRGLPFGILRYLGNNRDLKDRLAALPKPEVSFNYLGQFGQSESDKSGFDVAREPIGSVRSLRDERSHLLEISGSVNRGRLETTWFYSRNYHRRETIAQLAALFLEELRSLLTVSSVASLKVPQFDKARAAQKDIEKLLAKFGGTGGTVE